MEGIAYEYAIYYDIIKALAPNQRYERVLSVGGGSGSAIFAQIKSDVLGIPVSACKEADTALLACCSIAGYGVGLFDDITQLTAHPSDYFEIAEPHESTHEVYKAQKEVFSELYDALHGTYERLLRSK
jgi:xylulokinase